MLLAQSRLAVPFQPQLGTAIIIATTATIITTVTIIATTPTIRGTTITATTRGIATKEEKNFEAASRAAFFFHFIHVSRGAFGEQTSFGKRGRGPSDVPFQIGWFWFVPFQMDTRWQLSENALSHRHHD